jgi:hypothetical protein
MLNKLQIEDNLGHSQLLSKFFSAKMISIEGREQKTNKRISIYPQSL